jgi:alpha-ribazole phosphatase
MGDTMPHLILVRHGETAWNAQRRYQGIADIPLSELGQAQAAALAECLTGERIDMIHASDLQRACHTAETIATRHGLPVCTDPRLREIAFGRWEGLTYAEIEARYPTELGRWVMDPASCPPPGGEALDRLQVRVASWLGELAQGHSHQAVLVVAHGGSLQMLLCLALGLSPAARWRFRVDPASISALDLYAEGAILSLLNDRHHLEGV